MTTQGALLRPRTERLVRRLWGRVLVGVTLLCVVAISGGCSGEKDRRAARNAILATTLAIADPVDHLDVV